MRLIWILFCALVGAGLGALLGWLEFESTPLTIAASIVGGLLGRLIGKHFTPLDILSGT